MLLSAIFHSLRYNASRLSAYYDSWLVICLEFPFETNFLFSGLLKTRAALGGLLKPAFSIVSILFVCARLYGKCYHFTRIKIHTRTYILLMSFLAKLSLWFILFLFQNKTTKKILVFFGYPNAVFEFPRFSQFECDLQRKKDVFVFADESIFGRMAYFWHGNGVITTRSFSFCRSSTSNYGRRFFI